MINIRCTLSVLVLLCYFDFVSSFILIILNVFLLPFVWWNKVVYSKDISYLSLVGVVFENLNDDGDAELPPHVVYKIRQNASFTANTKSVRDKYWHPGPGSSSEAYYQFGFVWLQVGFSSSSCICYSWTSLYPPLSWFQNSQYHRHLHCPL